MCRAQDLQATDVWVVWGCRRHIKGERRTRLLRVLGTHLIPGTCQEAGADGQVEYARLGPPVCLLPLHRRSIVTLMPEGQSFLKASFPYRQDYRRNHLGTRAVLLR